MNNIFGASIQQANGKLWIVEILNQNKRVIAKESFENYKQAKEFMNAVTR